MPLELTPSESRNDLINNSWFAEKEAMWPGQKFCIEVDEVLENGRSDFQVNIHGMHHFQGQGSYMYGFVRIFLFSRARRTET